MREPGRLAAMANPADSRGGLPPLSAACHNLPDYLKVLRMYSAISLASVSGMDFAS